MEEGEGAVWFSVCGVSLDGRVNGGSVDVFFTYGMVLVLWGVGPILENGYGILGQNYVVLLQGSDISAGLHCRNLIFAI